jgi:hypothetical protein
MIQNRFSDELISPPDRLSPHGLTGFMVMPVAAAEQAQASPLQWLYQQMCQQAMQAQSAPKARDLFAVMN